MENLNAAIQNQPLGPSPIRWNTLKRKFFLGGFLPGANEAQFEVNLATGEPLDERVREFAVRDLENLR